MESIKRPVGFSLAEENGAVGVRLPREPSGFGERSRFASQKRERLEVRRRLSLELEKEPNSQPGNQIERFFGRRAPLADENELTGRRAADSLFRAVTANQCSASLREAELVEGRAVHSIHPDPF